MNARRKPTVAVADDLGARGIRTFLQLLINTAAANLTTTYPIKPARNA